MLRFQTLKSFETGSSDSDTIRSGSRSRFLLDGTLVEEDDEDEEEEGGAATADEEEEEETPETRVAKVDEIVPAERSSVLAFLF
jgi:hypothetical protein